MLEGMQAGVGAVIAAVVYEMARGIVHGRNWISIGIMAASFLAACVFGTPVTAIVLVCIAVGIARTFLEKRRKTECPF